jgi:valyl-tRNA synthetase
MFEQVVLKIGTYMLIYIALTFSQAVHPEIYETNKRINPKRTSKRIPKWAHPIKEWVIKRASRIGSTVDQWVNHSLGLAMNTKGPNNHISNAKTQSSKQKLDIPHGMCCGRYAS